MLTTEQVSEYNEKGFLVIPEFLSKDELHLVNKEVSNIIDKIDPKEEKNVFQETLFQKGTDYYLEAGDKIRYFFEEEAINEKGEFVVPKEIAISKLGYGLHFGSPIFRKITFSQKIKDIVRSLGFVDPVVVQGMYIFKNPKVGCKALCHQDASYFYSEPTVNLLGVWIPIKDVTLENGCLWFLPGSHKGEVYKRYERNYENGFSMKGIDVFPTPDYDENDFVPVVIPKGSCVLIHGKVFHKSAKNRSDNPRPAYTFHIFENHNAHYSEKNWLQPSFVFPSVYNTV